MAVAGSHDEQDVLTPLGYQLPNSI